MELLHLECFVTLADELHFGRAAARLHIGTPAMSKRIAELERTLGVRLFDRTSRDVRITPEGETLLTQATLALSEVSAFRSLAADAASGAIGGIRAAYSPGTGELMTILTRDLRLRSPGVVVHAIQMISIRVAAAVRSKTVAVGIARVPPGPDLATLLLAESPLNAVVMSGTHPLADRDLLRTTDLAGETLVGPTRAITGGEGGEGGGDGVSPARFREADVTSEGELFDLVSAGFGVYVTTEGIVRRNPRQDIVVRPLADYPGMAREFLIWRPDDDSPVVRAVCEVATAARPEMARLMLGQRSA
jgi:DNA-binding transcriptional LysR family regulator